MCNIGRNGTDGLGHTCDDGTYCCFCFNESHSHHHHHHWPPPTVPCNSTVGMANVFERHGAGKGSTFCLKDYQCFSQRASQKFTSSQPGMWYSPLSIGACSLHSSPAANCTWRVQSVDKIVSKRCHGASFFGAVRDARPLCFAGCSSPHTNTSDPCWVRCFYEAVLGPTAGRPFGKVAGGLPLEDVLAFWRRPFESEDAAHGGCPALPIPPLDTAAPQSVEPAQLERLTRRQRLWRAFAAQWASPTTRLGIGPASMAPGSSSSSGQDVGVADAAVTAA